jgi:hypothetical protein
MAKAGGLYLISLCQGNRDRYDRTGDKRFNQPPLLIGSRPTRKGYVQVELVRRALAPCRSAHVSCTRTPETPQERRSCFSHKRVPLLTGLTETVRSKYITTS